MHKIRLSLSSDMSDFARLYEFDRGFRGDSSTLNLPTADKLNLFISSLTSYTLMVEGDASLEEDTDLFGEGMQYFSVGWSEEAKANSKGSATLKVIHPEFPEEPSVWHLTLADFSFQHNAAKHDCPPEMAQEGIRRMMMLEAAHQVFAFSMSDEIVRHVPDAVKEHMNEQIVRPEHM